MKPKTHQPLEVWKFGGASLADAAAVRRAVAMIAAHRGPLVVVVSALAGVTDALLEGARLALAKDADASARLGASLLKRHEAIAARLVPRGQRKAVLALLREAAREYQELCHAVASLGELAPRTTDLLVSRGERMAAALVAAALSKGGSRAISVDAAPLIATDDQHGGAAPDFVATRRLVRRALRPILARRMTPILPGFIGHAPDGTLTTLGRGGSDLTATLLARALGAGRVTLWKDVPGILTSDPRIVPDARLIPQLHYREAAEVAYFGAKVLHPRALIPIVGTRTMVHVRSFLNPERPGTEVSGRKTLAGYPVKALAMVPGQSLVTVAGKGMMGVHGIAARTFRAVDAERLSVSTIFQASSESSIGFTLPEAQAGRAVAALQKEFRDELAAGLIDDVTAQNGMVVLAVVGEGMAGTPGIAARVFSALSAGAVNVVAIAQGSSERNISFVVTAPHAQEAARRVHAAFQLSKIGGGSTQAALRTDVVLLGFGRVGRALSDQIASANDSTVRVVGLLDRSGYVFDPKGLSRRRLVQLAQEKDRGALLAALGGHRANAGDALTHMASHAVSRPVLVDVTADDTSSLLLSGLDHGFDLILANKKPLAGNWESYTQLFSKAEGSGRRIRYEATVGAGLPIIDTHQKLVETGDRVLKVEGCVSGTLMYVASALSAGRRFSDAVREAVEKGYAEPDPRDDLSGLDVARKGLILARLLGYRGPAPNPENLVPPRLRKLPKEAFLSQLSSLDDEWAARVAKEAKRGRVLRYVVEATPRSVRVGLVAVPISSPIGSLQGTRNLVSFTTTRYRTEPLVVTGPGAGAEVTAAGILNDIHRLASL